MYSDIKNNCNGPSCWCHSYLKNVINDFPDEYIEVVQSWESFAYTEHAVVPRMSERDHQNKNISYEVLIIGHITGDSIFYFHHKSSLVAYAPQRGF